MRREEISSTIDQAIDALAADRKVDALAILRTLQVALQPKPKRSPATDPAAFDAEQLTTLQAAYGRALAGTITRAEVAELVGRFQRLPVPEAVALARAFGCTWLPARTSRAAALRAIADTLLGPIEARERAAF